jgi:short-subunit dehydrogenase
MNWKGRTVLLTGASSGIGEALAIALARKGAILGLIARRGELLADLALQAGWRHCPVVSMRCHDSGRCFEGR